MKTIIIFLGMLALLILPVVLADSYASLDPNCVMFCNQKNYTKALDCFKETQNKPDALLSTATCAFNNRDDAIAEQYAVDSARQKEGWMRFLRKVPGVNVKTGGLGENYALAYVASGGVRHEDKAIDYLKTSGQCKNDPEQEKCAEQYFNTVVMQYSARNLQSARSTGPVGVQAKVTGKITDSFGKPLKHATVTFKCANIDYPGKTDANGYYAINVADIDPAQACREGRVYVKLEYHNPADDRIIYIVQLYNQNVWYMKKFPIAAPADLKQDIQLTGNLSAASYFTLPGRNINLAEDMAAIYVHMGEAVEYYQDVLKANINYRLPLLVKTGPNDAHGTHYNPYNANAWIVLSGNDALLTSDDWPKNREWHEFGHHVMYSEYRTWPQASAAVSAAYGPQRNHDGYINPSTSDSYMEGFAEYGSLAIANHLALSDPNVYASWGTLERDIKVWENSGRDEELAVAGVLLDLADSANDDAVDYSDQEMWDILKTYHRDFTAIYEDFIAKYGANKKTKAAIDQVFINHGFFSCPDKGNGYYQGYEAFRDTNSDWRLTAGENWTDYSQYPGMPVPWMFYKEGMKVGSAANYWRMARRNTVMTPGHFIKVDDDWPSFRVKVSFPNASKNDYEIVVNNEDGRIFFRIPTEANIQVMPEGAPGKILRFSSSDFYDHQEDATKRGYLMEEDFGITATPPTVKAGLGEGSPDTTGKPYWDTMDLIATDADYTYRAPEEEPLPTEDGTKKVGKQGVLGSLPGEKPSVQVIIMVAALVVFVILVAIVFWTKSRKKRREKKDKHG